MQTLDVYEDGTPKPRYRVRVHDGFSLARRMHETDLSGGWLVVPTEEGGELAIDLQRASRMVIRARTEHDEKAYEEQHARAL